MGIRKERPFRNVKTLRTAPLLLAITTLLAPACSPSDIATNSSNNSSSEVNIAAVANTSSLNGVDPNPNMPANANIESASNRFKIKLEEMRAAAANTSSKPVPINARSAPEDSTITTQLTDVAREIRVWQKHPTLAKVEKVYDGNGSSIKVYLRDGRVIDLPGTAVPQLDQVPSATVLTLSGITAGASRSNESKTGRALKKTDK